MRLVFRKFERSLSLKTDAVNVVRVEDPALFARCALSLAQGFPDDSLEPAYFFTDDNKEVKANKVLYFAGDLLFLNLNDKRIVTQALKFIVTRMVEEGSSLNSLERLNLEMESVLEDQFLQMQADYCVTEEWDATKYLKMLGFGIDDSSDRTLFEKLLHFLRLMTDLFPDQVIAFVNLPNYLTAEQYNVFCEQVASLQLCVLSYEQGLRTAQSDFENVLSIDANYLEQ